MLCSSQSDIFFLFFVLCIHMFLLCLQLYVYTVSLKINAQLLFDNQLFKVIGKVELLDSFGNWKFSVVEVTRYAAHV